MVAMNLDEHNRTSLILYIIWFQKLNGSVFSKMVLTGSTVLTLWGEHFKGMEASNLLTWQPKLIA